MLASSVCEFQSFEGRASPVRTCSARPAFHFPSERQSPNGLSVLGAPDWPCVICMAVVRFFFSLHSCGDVAASFLISPGRRAPPQAVRLVKTAGEATAGHWQSGQEAREDL